MGIGALQSCGIGQSRAQFSELRQENIRPSMTNRSVTVVEETTSVAVSENIVASVESAGSESGVIRNLLDGHFRGVADVRLRINFADEIAALEAEKAAAQTQTGISEINGMVTSEIESFLQTEGLDEELSAVIGDGIAAFMPDAESVDSSSTVSASADGNSIAQLQSTFDTYIESIRTALAGLAQDVPEVVTETPENALLDEPMTVERTLPVTGESSTAPDWQSVVEQFIIDLSMSFETALSDLNAELENLTVLPELSQPNGHGRAYDKFLSIYNEIRQSGADLTEQNSISVTA